MTKDFDPRRRITDAFDTCGISPQLTDQDIEDLLHFADIGPEGICMIAMRMNSANMAFPPERVLDENGERAKKRAFARARGLLPKDWLGNPDNPQTCTHEGLIRHLDNCGPLGVKYREMVMDLEEERQRMFRAAEQRRIENARQRAKRDWGARNHGTTNGPGEGEEAYHWVDPNPRGGNSGAEPQHQNSQDIGKLSKSVLQILTQDGGRFLRVKEGPEITGYTIVDRGGVRRINLSLEQGKKAIEDLRRVGYRKR